VGMVNRLARIFGNDGRSLIIAADHRQRGVQHGLEDFACLASNLVSVLRFADALVATKEPMRHIMASWPEGLPKRGLLLSLNRTGLSESAFEWDDRLVVRPQTAVRWGLDGAKLLIRIDPTRAETSRQLEMCGEICDICERWDLPLILEPLYCTQVRGRLKVDYRPDKIRYAAIVAADFSVPALKIPYPDGPSRSSRRRSFRDIVHSVNARVLVLGGRKVRTKAFLERSQDAILDGGSGLVIGRNVLLDRNPSLVTCALQRIIHQGEDADTALANASREAMA